MSIETLIAGAIEALPDGELGELISALHTQQIAVSQQRMRIDRALELARREVVKRHNERTEPARTHHLRQAPTNPGGL